MRNKAFQTLRAMRTAWHQQPARARHWLLVGASVSMLSLMWSWTIAPAWSVWREAPTRQARIDARTHQMLQLQALAQKLQTPSHIDRREALDALQTTADRLLGPGAKLQLEGEQLRVTLQATPARALAQWLAEARDTARALPLQATLQRADAADHTEALWQGFLLMRLP